MSGGHVEIDSAKANAGSGPVSLLQSLLRLVHDWGGLITITGLDLLRRPTTIILLLVSLCAASALIALDLAYRYAELDGTKLPIWFDVSLDGGLGEIYEYILVGAGAIALGLAAIRLRSGIFAALAALLAYIDADNSLQIHEQMGELLGGYVPAMLGLEAAHAGEAIFMLGMGLVILSVSAAVLRYRCDRLGASAAIIIGLVVIAGTFGIVVDAATSFFKGDESGMLIWLIALEDGGELVFLGLLGTVSCAVAWESRRWIMPSSERIKP